MLADFTRYLEAERRYSPLTVRNYRHDVEQFLAWLGVGDADFDPCRVTTEDIREWMLFRTEEGHLSAASMNREISSLRALFRWLLRRWRRGWLLTAGAAALALILFLWASTIPIPGSEGPMLWAIQAACLTLGAGVVELVLKLKRRL